MENGWPKRERMLDRWSFPSERLYDDETTTFAQATFGWGLEDIGMQIADMAGAAKETTYSMGDDAPLAVLSERPHVLYNYFKQRFAQVTNPPIDPLREGIVMSLGHDSWKEGKYLQGIREGSSLDSLGIARLESGRNGPYCLVCRTGKWWLSSKQLSLPDTILKMVLLLFETVY